MDEPILDSTVQATTLLVEALRLLDRAGLTLPAAHVEHALQILRDVIQA